MTNNTATEIIPVILCGGSGSRLWPLSRGIRPKQFLKLNGNYSLLQETVLRTQKACETSMDKFVFVTLEDTGKELRQQLEELGSQYTQHILYEPSARNTAAAVAFAAQYVSKQFGDSSIMWILPADHHISDGNALKQALEETVTAAQQGYLTTFGIIPTRPETGYGYIRITDETVTGQTRKAAKFVEKPNLETAKTYIKGGNYLWNSGMFVFKTNTIIENYTRHANEIMQYVQSSMEHDSKHPSSDIYKKIPKVPFDTAIMEKSDKVAVIPCDMGWSDIGSWESLWEISEKDKQGNVTYGITALKDTQNCMIHAKNRLVACAGLDNIVVIETADAILIADKSNTDSMKELVAQMKKSGRPEIETFMAAEMTSNSSSYAIGDDDERPWGSYIVTDIGITENGDDFCEKDITINSGEILSLQSHEFRREFWTVKKGTLTILCDDMRKTLKAEDSISIPMKSLHCMANLSHPPCIVHERQEGICRENDITRYVDNYGRATQTDNAKAQKSILIYTEILAELSSS